MSIEGLIAAFLIMVIVGLWILFPLLGEPAKTKVDVSQQRKDFLVSTYEGILSIIRDLDDDHATGKINSDDYQREREDWTQRGIAILKLLDSLDSQGIMTVDASEEASIDDAIEQAVAAYRARQS